MEEQLQQAMRDHCEYCINKAYSFVNDWAAAEEIVQDVFLAYAKNMTAFKGNASLKTYLVKITHNKSIDYIRRQKELVLTDEDLNIPIQSIEKAAIVNEEKHLIFHALSELPNKYRDTLYYYYYENYNIPQIASIVCESENTIKTRLVRGRSKLKSILPDRNWEVLCS